MTEFNLTDKELFIHWGREQPVYVKNEGIDAYSNETPMKFFFSEDVREFIKLLKETLILDDYAIGSPRGEDYYIDILKKLAGDKLI